MDEQPNAFSSQFDVIRYPALVQVWYHHNQMQLQWPALIVGTVIVFLSYIIVVKASKVLNMSAWGHDNELTFVVGMPMVLTGIGLLIVLHLMRRARLIMGVIENQLAEMEKGRVHLTFKEINHPPGHSGAKVIWYFMLLCLALPMLAFGILFSLGLFRSLLVLIVLLGLTIAVKIFIRDSLKDRPTSDRPAHALPLRNANVLLVQAISLYRLFASVVFLWLAFEESSRMFLSLLYATAMLSDLADGYMSRRLQSETRFGRVLDLTADKSLTVVSLLYAATRGLDVVPLALIAIRDIAIMGMRSITVEGKCLIPTNRIFGGVMALFIWGNTLLLVHASATGHLIKVTTVVYWICALILAVNLVVRLYVSRIALKEAFTY